MADRCPDHGKPVLGYCGGCVRPYCASCDVKGTVPRCAECRGVASAGEVKPIDVGRRTGLGSGALVFLVVAAGAGVWLSTVKGCPVDLPAEWHWRHVHSERKD